MYSVRSVNILLSEIVGQLYTWLINFTNNIVTKLGTMLNNGLPIMFRQVFFAE